MLSQIKQLSKKFSYESFINSIKTVIACLIGLAIAIPLNLSMPQWILVSIVIVMAANVRVGSAFKKSYLRILGTLLGAVTSIIVIFLVGDNPFYIYSAMLILVGIFSYFASSTEDISYMGLLGATTVVMVLYAKHPSLELATDRIIEISSGVLIAILTTKFLFPRHSLVALKKTISENLADLKSLYELFIETELNLNTLTTQEELENKIIKNFANQTKLFEEAKNEKRKFRLQTHLYQRILMTQRKLLRCLYMLRQALAAIKNQNLLLQNSDIARFNADILAAFDYLISINDKLPNNKKLPQLRTQRIIDDEFQLTIKTIETMSSVQFHTFIFCIQHLEAILIELMDVLPKLFNQPNK